MCFAAACTNPIFCVLTHPHLWLVLAGLGGAREMCSVVSSSTSSQELRDYPRGFSDIRVLTGDSLCLGGKDLPKHLSKQWVLCGAVGFKVWLSMLTSVAWLRFKGVKMCPVGTGKFCFILTFFPRRFYNNPWVGIHEWLWVKSKCVCSTCKAFGSSFMLPHAKTSLDFMCSALVCGVKHYFCYL